VKVKNGLSCSRPHVQYSSIPLLDVALACDLRGSQVTFADDFGISGLRFFQACEVPLRNDQNMRRRFRIDVFEGENVFVFVNFLRKNFTADDAAEEAIRVSHDTNLHRLNDITASGLAANRGGR